MFASLTKFARNYCGEYFGSVLFIIKNNLLYYFVFVQYLPDYMVYFFVDNFKYTERNQDETIRVSYRIFLGGKNGSHSRASKLITCCCFLYVR